ncbi:YcaO-like family protein [Planomonospora sp. ID67723]|uniref:YcaO-like family protein n=1 Tax=Planomonospora sp. ID67723 TaxID=2738134 RepID=UPI0018C44333|nr:YcaO-like family protein [Planomonospora sp. ID67723]MBG0829783.1 YcaO-like family protein [Planomonospora sp. ID67723]
MNARVEPPPLSIADPLTGIVTWSADLEIERSDPDVFVTVAQSGNLVGYGLPEQATANGSGAGLTREAARRAAVGESAERYACAFVHPEDLTLASYSELHGAGTAAVPPERWALFTGEQYETSRYTGFADDTSIAWTAADNLTSGGRTLVPASLVHMPYPRQFADRGEQIVAEAVSTGTACAPIRAEAIMGGLCEVIERDAFMIVWRNRLSRPRIVIDEASGLLETFGSRFDRPWLDYRLWYTTLDLSVPACFGLLRDKRHSPARTVVGGACHPDPARAVLKTLLELTQGLQWMAHARNRERRSFPSFDDVRTFEDRMHLYAFGGLDEAFGFLDRDGGRVRLSAIPSLAAPNPGAAVDRCCEAVEQAALEPLAVDLTSADLEACGLFVVKVLIPECVPMEGDHRLPFLGGDRWRDVPVRLGLRHSPTPLHAINPFPHPYP